VTGKTIVYLPNWLGDMVMAVPFLHALRTNLRDELWVVGKESAIHLYNGLNLFDRFIPVGNAGLSFFIDAGSQLRKIDFARAIALPHSFRSALFFCNLRIREIIGYARNRRGFILSRKIQESLSLESTVEHYLKISDTLGIPRSIEAPYLTVTPDEESKFDQEFTKVARPFAVMIVGAQYGPSKCWPAGYFSELADSMIEQFDLNVYMLPGRDEKAIADRVHAGIKRKDRADILSMNIREMKVCLSRAAVVVSNDTGPRHISAALSVPTIVFAGPMDEEYTAYSSPSTRVLSRDVPCRPCNSKRCEKGHECMTEIKPQEVAGIVGDIIGKKT
jgi:heptosyltransferase II